MHTHLQGSTSDLLYTNHVKGQERVEGHDCFNHHLGKEVLLLVDQLAVEGGTSTLFQDGPQLNRILLVDLWGGRDRVSWRRKKDTHNGNSVWCQVSRSYSV